MDIVIVYCESSMYVFNTNVGSRHAIQDYGFKAGTPPPSTLRTGVQDLLERLDDPEDSLYFGSDVGGDLDFSDEEDDEERGWRLSHICVYIS